MVDSTNNNDIKLPPFPNNPNKRTKLLCEQHCIINTFVDVLKTDLWSVVVLVLFIILPLFYFGFNVPPLFAVTYYPVVSFIYMVIKKQEICDERFKSRLIVYLEKYTRKSFFNIAKDWPPEDGLIEKDLQRMIRIFPKVFKETPVKDRGRVRRGISLLSEE